MPDQKPLVEEYEFYRNNRNELISKHNGKFALIKGRELVGVFDTDQDAYKAGLLRFGNVPFMIVRVQEGDEKNWIPILQLGLLNAGS